MRHINEAGIALIKASEGLRLDSYQDSVGVWTIGFGSTRGVKAGMRITTEQADDRLREDLAVAEQCVERCAVVTLTDNEFAALVSFSFNLGCGALRGSTLLRKLNAGEFDEAADEFKRWNHAGGHILAGLTDRRAAESALFETA